MATAEPPRLSTAVRVLELQFVDWQKCTNMIVTGLISMHLDNSIERHGYLVQMMGDR